MSISKIDCSTKQAIQTYQESQLTKALQYVAIHSRFYKAHFRNNNINPLAIRTLKDLVEIPVTTKNDLQRHNWDFLCVPKEEVGDFAITSGTLGAPVTIGLTKSDLMRLAQNEYSSFLCADGSSRDRYQLMLTLDRQFMAGIAYYEGLKKLGAGIIRVGPGAPDMQFDSILRYEPTCLIAVPSFLVKLVEYVKQQGQNLSATSVKKAICIGESIRNNDFSLNEIGKRIKATWDISLYSTYASTEMQTAFTECSFGVGGHHNPELIIVELLNENGEPVKAGEPGEVTITTLGVEGMPLIRYNTGDISIGHDQPCVCGRNTMRLGPILGRRQQMIKLKGTTLYPPAVSELLNKTKGVYDHVAEVTTSALGTDSLTLYLLIEDAAVKQRVINSFNSKLRVTPDVKIVDRSELDKLQLARGRKIARFLDNRKT
ncbi:MAG: AMP-binding protein [Cyclobacteriaceae bacterium]